MVGLVVPTQSTKCSWVFAIIKSYFQSTKAGSFMDNDDQVKNVHDFYQNQLRDNWLHYLLTISNTNCSELINDQHIASRVSYSLSLPVLCKMSFVQETSNTLPSLYQSWTLHDLAMLVLSAYLLQFFPFSTSSPLSVFRFQSSPAANLTLQSSLEISNLLPFYQRIQKKDINPTQIQNI